MGVWSTLLHTSYLRGEFCRMQTVVLAYGYFLLLLRTTDLLYGSTTTTTTTTTHISVNQWERSVCI
jgi:hypothetical protein